MKAGRQLVSWEWSAIPPLFDVRNLMVKGTGVEKVLWCRNSINVPNQFVPSGRQCYRCQGSRLAAQQCYRRSLAAWESEDQITAVAEAGKKPGASLMRVAFKPSDFALLFPGSPGRRAGFTPGCQEETGLPIVTEIMSAGDD